MSTAPDRHFTTAVRSNPVSSVDCLINSAQWKHALVLLGEGGQIGWLRLELGAEGTVPLSIIAMARRATRQVLRFPLVEVFRPSSGTRPDQHAGNRQPPRSSFLHHELRRWLSGAASEFAGIGH